VNPTGLWKLTKHFTWASYSNGIILLSPRKACYNNFYTFDSKPPHKSRRCVYLNITTFPKICCHTAYQQMGKHVDMRPNILKYMWTTVKTTNLTTSTHLELNCSLFGQEHHYYRIQKFLLTRNKKPQLKPETIKSQTYLHTHTHFSKVCLISMINKHIYIIQT